MSELNIAKLIGAPVREQLPCAVELTEIADIFYAEPGEHVWRYSTVDTTADVVLAVSASDGAITVVKRTPMDDVELTFTDLNSKLEYVLAHQVINSPDLQALAARKASITRGMDKRELQLILAAILANTAGYLPGENCQEYTVQSTDDLYDCIMGMKQAVEDYGDDFVLLCGSTVKNKIDTYDKDKAESHNYNVTLTAKLRELGIKVMKVYGNVSYASNETETAVMTATSAILVARNSRIADGKPIKFVRRKISADQAALMGCEVDAAKGRGLWAAPTPINVSGVNTLGYGVYGFESVIFCITNPKAICLCDLSTVVS